MKIRALLVAMSVATVLTGCQNMDSNGLLSSGAEAFQAYSLSDAQVKTLSDQACQEMDSKATIAPANSEYAKRLTTIANALGNNINGQPVNYKVYMAKDVNAFAMANGCIRVYSGLMDMMTDNEVEAVIGHEMGHVALGHVKKGMQVALGTNAVRAAAASAAAAPGYRYARADAKRPDCIPAPFYRKSAFRFDSPPSDRCQSESTYRKHR